METIAKHRFARIAPRKARLVIDLIRGVRADRAVEMLAFSNKKAAPMVKKVLISAMHNAKHNHGLDIGELWVSRACVDEGARFKRALPRAKGRGDHIIKRTSHIILAVSASKGR